MMVKSLVIPDGRMGGRGDSAGLERLSSHAQDEIYRCPVSTPTLTRRPSVKSSIKSQPFISFTSLNHSLKVPNNFSSKHPVYRSKKPLAKPQRKNFDCYFVNTIEKTVHIDAQTQSTWLSSLCSQPVDEIFGKYKRKSEASRSRPPTTGRSTTPGEKALFTAWSSNASNRGSPTALTRCSMQGRSAPSRASRMSSVDHGVDYDIDRTFVRSSAGFALMPVTPTNLDGDETPPSPSTPLFHGVFKNSNNTSSVYSSNADATAYEPYQRDKRFPDIKPRKSTFSPTRKRIPPSESGQDQYTGVHTASMAASRELQESPMQIVSINRMMRDAKQMEDNEQGNLPPLPNGVSYRLPKRSLTMSLPELHGKG
ncbi:uncharacterized protein LOC128238881 [Mya arenaria]|uniref:uncharacterized protein LOC128238881 n=1 Tax=Mya arenaria TaxID=6604 RepID=UPI0022E59553|nr:uncharacterized protein LOC128238881 [Mya arenaria]